MKKIDLSRLQNRFIQLVEAYKAENGLSNTDLAKLVGVGRTHLGTILNNGADRKLTAYYLLPFIRKGIISVSEIKDNSVQTDREQDFWDTASEAENYDLLKKIALLRKKGVPIDETINSLLKAHSK